MYYATQLFRRAHAKSSFIHGYIRGRPRKNMIFTNDSLLIRFCSFQRFYGLANISFLIKRAESVICNFIIGYIDLNVCIQQYGVYRLIFGLTSTMIVGSLINFLLLTSVFIMTVLLFAGLRHVGGNLISPKAQ